MFAFIDEDYGADVVAVANMIRASAHLIPGLFPFLDFPAATSCRALSHCTFVGYLLA